MYHIWRTVYTIMRNCLACKYGEQFLACWRMINCLYHIYDHYVKKKQIDILDYMWHEMQIVVANNRVLIFCPLLQHLINTMLPESIVHQFAQVYHPLVPLHPLPEVAPVWLPPGVNPAADDVPFDDVPKRVLKKGSNRNTPDICR